MANTTLAKLNSKAHMTELDARSDAIEREDAAVCGWK